MGFRKSKIASIKTVLNQPKFCTGWFGGICQLWKKLLAEKSKVAIYNHLTVHKVMKICICAIENHYLTAINLK